MREDWLPVPGYEGLYEVSDHGSVRTTRRQGSSGGLLKPSLDPQGYLKVKLYAKGGGKTYRIHQLVALTFIGTPEPGQEVRHLDGNYLHNALGNLTYGTRTDQRLDDVRNGVHFYAKRPACGQGHEYTPENTYRGRKGKQRVCRACRRGHQRRYRQKVAA